MRLLPGFLLLLVVTLLAASAGCNGGKLTVVQGSVTVNGQPLESGAISLTPISGQGAAAGAEISQGKFEIRASGLTAGEYSAAINAFRRTGKKTWDGMGDERAPASQKHYVEETEQYLPAKYNAQTELTATLLAGQVNQLKFDLNAATGPK